MRNSSFAPLVIAAAILLLAGCGGKADLDGDLLKAVEEGQLADVTTLLKKGADVNSTDDFDRTPLMMSALGGHTEIVQTLIESGADLDATAKYGQTALKFAEEQGNSEIVNMLRAAGARS